MSAEFWNTLSLLTTLATIILLIFNFLSARRLRREIERQEREIERLEGRK